MQAAKQRMSGRLVAALQGTLAPGEEVRTSFPGTTRPALPFLFLIPWVIILVILLATFSLGVLGILVLAIVGGVLVGTLLTLVARRFAVALALTDRRLLWVPWNGKSATGPVVTSDLAELRVATKAGLMGTTLAIRWADGAERRVTAPRVWQQEAGEIAGAVSTDRGEDVRPE